MFKRILASTISTAVYFTSSFDYPCDIIRLSDENRRIEPAIT